MIQSFFLHAENSLRDRNSDRMKNLPERYLFSSIDKRNFNVRARPFLLGELEFQFENSQTVYWTLQN